MKKIIGTLMLSACLFAASFAQKNIADKVPANVKAAFAKLHPAVNAKWEKEKQNFEAAFKVNGKSTSEVYNAKGELLETETELALNNLPAEVQAKLKGLKVKETAKITKADGSVVYEAEVKGKDLLFDAKGNAVKH